LRSAFFLHNREKKTQISILYIWGGRRLLIWGVGRGEDPWKRKGGEGRVFVVVGKQSLIEG